MQQNTTQYCLKSLIVVKKRLYIPHFLKSYVIHQKLRMIRSEEENKLPVVNTNNEKNLHYELTSVGSQSYMTAFSNITEPLSEW